MRERFRVTAAEALVCLVVIVLQTELWLTRRPGATTEITGLTVGCALLLVVGIAVARLGTRRAHAAQALADAATEEERAVDAAQRARVLRERHDAMAEAVNSVIVEIVAAQQAVVRSAYPDDILTRLRAAEDHAHGSLEELAKLDTPEDPHEVTKIRQPTAAV
jgi:acyl-CoA reductase-like NAD-dependent aldehyde dehydrogenase